MLKVGIGSHISPRARILSMTGNDENIIIGDHCYIGDDVQIICDDFKLGDYGKVHHHVNIHGRSVHIGHNAWIGQYTIIDGLGRATIGDNCGIGAHSQLWSHMRFGDTLEGCRFDTLGELIIGKDVWFVGHCIVSPIFAGDKSMALVGSVITKNMESQHTYAGSPAKDITEKFGSQFINVSIKDKKRKMISYWEECGSSSDIVIVENISEFNDDTKTYFAIDTRQYTKRSSADEITFMKYLLPTRAKFTPYDSI